MEGLAKWHDRDSFQVISQTTRENVLQMEESNKKRLALARMPKQR